MRISDRVKTGPDKAPHRSLWKALGLTDEELTRPLIGVVSAQSDCVPGHNHLKNIAQAVKDGIFTITNLVPALGFLLLGLVLVFWYPLHKKQVDENVAILKAKRGE